MSRLIFMNLCSCLLLFLLMGNSCCLPVSAQTHENESKSSKYYIAQDSDEQYSEEEVVEEQSSEEVAADRGSEANSEGGYSGGERVSLATVFLSAVGMVFLIVFVLAIPISFSFLACGLVWKIGMMTRGGKKPDIG